MKRRRVSFTPEAAGQARVADEWWRANRPASPSLFKAELDDAVSLVGRAAGAGRKYDSAALAGVRRLPLQRTRFHVYYIVRADEVIVVAVWSALRGHGPPLPAAAP